MSKKLLGGTVSSGAASFDQAREQIHRNMLSAVSHDLKTPLATMIGSLEICMRMDDKLTAEKKKTLINSALTEAYRLDNFITNILDMAKLEGGLVTAKPERCDLTALLHDCLTRMGPKRDKADITLTPGMGGTAVHTDPMLLGRAAGLLLENAVRHAGKHPAIVVDYGVEGRSALIRIRDNGPGIPRGQEKAIFSKYTRLGKSDQQNAGTGLGLAICRSIMTTLEGEVMGGNHPAGGAIFTLVFPIKHATQLQRGRQLDGLFCTLQTF